MEPLLQVRDLTIRYRSAGPAEGRAVEGVSLDVARGEVVGVMGESGSGTSSIALALLGLLSKDCAEVSGSAVFRGEDLLSMNERLLQRVRGAGISMVYQEPGMALSPVMRAGMQIAEVIHAHREMSWKEATSEALTLLARVGLPSTDRIFSAYPHQLSGGQLQRVALAQGLACGPALLIADEPTASLDARSQSEFVSLLRELNQSSQISLLLISHTPEIQASLADRILVMKDGRIVDQGSFDRLYSHPSHPCTSALLRRNRSAIGHENPQSENAAHEQFTP